MFSYVSFTFLYLIKAKIQAIDPGFLPPKFSDKNNQINDYFHLSLPVFLSIWNLNISELSLNRTIPGTIRYQDRWKWFL